MPYQPWTKNPAQTVGIGLFSGKDKEIQRNHGPTSQSNGPQCGCPRIKPLAPGFSQQQNSECLFITSLHSRKIQPVPAHPKISWWKIPHFYPVSFKFWALGPAVQWQCLRQGRFAASPEARASLGIPSRGREQFPMVLQLAGGSQPTDGSKIYTSIYLYLYEYTSYTIHIIVYTYIRYISHQNCISRIWRVGKETTRRFRCATARNLIDGRWWYD